MSRIAARVPRPVRSPRSAAPDTATPAAASAPSVPTAAPSPLAAGFSIGRVSVAAPFLASAAAASPVQRVGTDDEALQMKAAAGATTPVQRMGVDDEEELQMKANPATAAPVQRMGTDEEEELQINADPSAAVPVQREASAPVPVAPNRTGLPDGLKSGIESLSGMSLDDVRVHRNSARAAEVGALAYAQGTDIHVGPGQEQHLPHEAWHVVQQKQGRVRPTAQFKAGVPLNHDAGLEAEADRMGDAALMRMKG